MEKKSPSLDRDAMYRKTSTITRLPSYLTIQFIRFHVGRAGASEEIVSKKILKVQCVYYITCTCILNLRLQ